MFKEKTSKINYKFCAGIVLYNPDDLSFVSAIEILKRLAIDVFVFDNSSSVEKIAQHIIIFETESMKDVVILKSPVGNVGLASAFNAIATCSLSSPVYDGVFLFDQDTSLNPQALLSIMAGFKGLVDDRQPLGVLAGYPLRKVGLPYRIRPVKNMPTPIPAIVPVKTVSSSFSLIPTDTFRKIGLFNETFFIDHIDMDFSMRCWKAGLPIYVQKEAKFTHNIGVGEVKLFNRFLFPVGDPYRHYYQVRNMIISYENNGQGIVSILKETVLRAVVVLIISINSGDSISRFKYLIKGIWDGFKRVGGKLAE